MIHFIFHFAVSMVILGKRYLAIECFQTILLFLLIVFIFPLCMKASGEIFSLFSLPILFLSLLQVIMLNFASFSYSEMKKTYYDLSHFSNHLNALYPKISMDWICIRLLILWMCIILSILSVLPICGNFLAIQNALLISLIKWIPFWIWNQLSLSAIISSMLSTVKNSFMLNCLIFMPLSIPSLLLITEASENLNYDLYLSTASIIISFLTLCNIFVMPRLVDLLIMRTNQF